MLSKNDIVLEGEKPLTLEDPGEFSEAPRAPSRGSSTLTGGPATQPVEPPAPAPAAKPKIPASPPRRLRQEDPEAAARIERRVREELDKEIADYQVRLFKGEPGYSSLGLRDLFLRRDHDQNEVFHQIDDNGRVRSGDEIVPALKPTDEWGAHLLPALTPEQGTWDVARVTPILRDLHDQGVSDADVHALFKTLAGEPSVSSAAEGGEVLRRELGAEKAAELGHVTNWYFDQSGVLFPSDVAWLEQRGWLEDPGFLKQVYAHALPRLEAEQKAKSIMADPKSAYWSLNDTVRRAAVAEVRALYVKARGSRQRVTAR